MGGLFGGGGSSSSATTKTTNVTTTTTSKVGDVGFTGAQGVSALQTFVDGVKSLIMGVTDVAKTQAIVNMSAVDSLAQESGKHYQQLIGGANKLIETAPAQTAAAVVPIANLQAGQATTNFKDMLIPAALLIGGIMIAKNF